MSTVLELILLHHCKRHDVHIAECKKCIWWSKHGKCQHKKPFDKDELFKSIVATYLAKKDPVYTLEQANEIASKVVEREMIRHGMLKP